MKNLKLLFLILVALILTQSAFSQRRFGGRVVEVIDGKTAVIQAQSGGRATVVLQFIEIPEAEQPLHQTVKAHLQELILNKYVEFLPRGLMRNASIGQVSLDGVDISQQMLRDGAAWYALAEKSGQNAKESESYQSNEAQAKTEKRGVWSITNLKPAWEFRAEKEELKRRAEKAKQDEIAAQLLAERQKQIEQEQQQQAQKKPVVRTQQRTGGFGLDMWSNTKNVESEEPNFTGLQTVSLPNYKIGYITTSSGFLKLPVSDSQPKIESRSIYVYSLDAQPYGEQQSGYVIGFLSASKEYNFAESNNLMIVADKQKFDLGRAIRFSRQSPYIAEELLIYRIAPETLSKIAGAKNLDVKLGGLSGKLGSDYQALMKKLLEATK